MTAILIDFATRQPIVRSAWRPQACGRLSLDERADLRVRWRHRQTALQAANHECQALDLRCMLEPAGSPARNRLLLALEIAAEARSLAWEVLLRTPAPNAEALA